MRGQRLLKEHMEKDGLLLILAVQSSTGIECMWISQLTAGFLYKARASTVCLSQPFPHLWLYLSTLVARRKKTFGTFYF